MDPNKVKELTVFIHGVWSNGGGFWPVVEDCRNDTSFPIEHHRIKVYDHGFTWPWEPWSNGGRKKLRDAIGGYLHKQMRKYPFCDNVNVIAHSYGTYGVCDYLLHTESDELTVDNLMLLNGVCPDDFDWEFVLEEKGMVHEVLNVMGSKDPVPILGPLVNLGTSGDHLFHSIVGSKGGFNTNVEAVTNFVVNGGHSWYQTEEGRRWLRVGLQKASETSAGNGALVESG